MRLRAKLGRHVNAPRRLVSTPKRLTLVSKRSVCMRPLHGNAQRGERLTWAPSRRRRVGPYRRPLCNRQKYSILRTRTTPRAFSHYLSARFVASVASAKVREIGARPPSDSRQVRGALRGSGGCTDSEDAAQFGGCKHRQ